MRAFRTKKANHAQPAFPASVPCEMSGMNAATARNAEARPQRLRAGIAERGWLLNDALLYTVSPHELGQPVELELLNRVVVAVFGLELHHVLGGRF